MRLGIRLTVWMGAALAAGHAGAEVIDRIAVSVGNRVITGSDIAREIRVTAFLNGVRPDLSPAARRAAAERLIEQKLIRRELESSRYPVPKPAEVEPVLRKFRQERLKVPGEYERALADYGITETDVLEALLWQRTLLMFIDVRFRPSVQVTDEEMKDYFDKTVAPAAQAARPGRTATLEEFRASIEKTLAGRRQDQEMNVWLQQSRRRTEIVFHEEAFR